ncbi:MAG: hypothetical protein ACRERU_03095 [Methylococcales bacterium]
MVTATVSTVRVLRARSCWVRLPLPWLPAWPKADSSFAVCDAGRLELVVSLGVSSYEEFYKTVLNNLLHRVLNTGYSILINLPRGFMPK